MPPGRDAKRSSLEADVEAGVAPLKGTSTFSLEHKNSGKDIHAAVAADAAEALKRRGGKVAPSDRHVDAPTMSLYRIMLDAYEFHGFNLLLYFLVYCTCAVCLLYAQWGGLTNYQPAFKAAVLTSLKGYACGTVPGYLSLQQAQPLMLADVQSIGGGVDYIAGYLGCAITQTQWLTPTNNSVVWLGSFARVTYARLFVDTSSNCQNHRSIIDSVTQEECSPDTPPYPALHDSIGGVMTNNSLWTKGAANGGSALHSDLWGATLIHQEEGVSLADFLNIVQDFQGNNTPGNITPTSRDFLSRSGGALKLQVFAFDRLAQDAAYFSLTIAFGPATQFVNHKTVLQIASSTVNPPVSHAMVAWYVLFIILAVLYTTYELRMIRLCYIQHHSLRPYLSYWWNPLSTFSELLNWAWIFWYAVIVKRSNDTPVWPTDHASMDMIESQADEYTGFLYFGIIVLFLLGLRICRFMRVHLGMRLLYLVFVDVATNIIDFAVFAIYVMLVLGVLCFAYFQISGGNPVFVNFPDGLGAMARLAFGYIDYDSFYNDSAGVKVTYGWTRSALFWLSVVCLNIFMINMLIAIFNDAYTRAQQKTLDVEFTFLKTIVMRTWFFFLFHFWLLPKQLLAPHDRNSFPDADVDYPEHGRIGKLHQWKRLRLRVHKQLVERMRKAPPPRQLLHNPAAVASAEAEKKAQHKYTRLWARWCIASCMEMQALVAFYTDFSSLKLTGRKTEWAKMKDVVIGSTTFKNPYPALKTDITRSELEALMEAVFKKRATLDKKNANPLMWPLHYNPFASLDERDAHMLLDAICDVYLRLPPPNADVKPGDDLDDNNQDHTLMLNQMRDQMTAQSQENAAMRADMARMMEHMERLAAHYEEMSNQLGWKVTSPGESSPSKGGATGGSSGTGGAGRGGPQPPAPLL